MSWFRVDDSFPDHPKVLRLQASRHWRGALSLWLLAGAWSSKHLTDGAVPDAIVKRLGCTLEEADALVTAGLWTSEAEGYAFHEWAERNPTRSKVLADREADRSRKRAPVGIQAEATRKANGLRVEAPPGAFSDSASPVPSRPVPSPESESRALSLAAGRDLDFRDGQSLREYLRSGVVEGYTQGLKMPAPKLAKHLMWTGWDDLTTWVREKASLTERDPRDVGKQLVRCFLRSAVAKRKGYPIEFLAQNAAEYWTDAEAA